MTNEVTWYQENRVIFSRIQGEATLQELVEGSAEITARIRQGAQTSALVHLIVDTQSMTKIPTNLLAVRQVTTYLNEPALGWTVVVGMSPVARFLASMVTQMAGVRFRMFPTFKEAVAFLVNQDESITVLEIQPQ